MRRTLLLLLLVAAAAWPAPAVTKEYKVKAGFLFNFAKFVTWPKEAFEKEDSPLVIGVLGKHRFGEVLRQFEKRTVKERPVVVRELTDLKKLDACHVLFLCESERKRVSLVLKALRRRPVLTVGELPGFAAAGGVINFKLRDRRVVFEINVAAAKRAGLRIHSKLLQLGEKVEDKP